MPKVLTRRAVLLIAPIGAALVSMRATAEGAAAEIQIENFVFSPDTLTIAAGTTVTWINHDDIPHSVVEKNGLFHSKALDTNDAFSFTFVAGAYEYFCGLHPHMTGKIVVKT
jgi:plastocyanin